MTEEDMTPSRLVKRMHQTEEILESWWARYYKDVFPLLVPRRKWMQAHRNLAVDDIVLVMYETRYAKDKYRMGRVTSLHPDNCGSVRTVTVAIKSREKAGMGPGAKVLLKLPVQRLVLILPVEEQQTQEVVEREEPLGEGDSADPGGPEGERAPELSPSEVEDSPEDSSARIPAAHPLPQRKGLRRSQRVGLRVQVPEATPDMKDL